MKPTTLTIRLAGGGQPPTAEQTFCDLHVGGPETLLSWLETQLGLRHRKLDHCTLVAQFQSRLKRCPDAVFAQSFQADAWATAAELLSRREELRLAGWDESDDPSLPRLVRDLAKIADSDVPLEDDSDRLAAILAALDKGQVLPPHECFLEDAAELWPLKWRPLLARLTLREPAASVPQAPANSALREAQTHCLHGSTGPLRLDASLRWIGTRSIVGACEAVGACLAADPDSLALTVVCCANPTAAIQLDGVLERLGLPTMGAGLKTREHPALQVLPLVLRLCWSPVDPSTLLDFLSLPVGPIKPRWARRLADALGQQPGFGSRAWEETVEELSALEGEEGQKAAERIQKWFGIERVPWGKPLPRQLVKSCCSRVAQWAAGYAALDRVDPVLAAALRLAAGQAATLGELVEGGGEEVSEPQLARMLDSAMASGVTVQPLGEMARGPILVTSLADVPECKRLIWLGLACEDGRGHRWTHQEREALRARGIELDDGSAWTASQRRAERAGLSRVAGSLLAVSLPDDQNQRPHPVWLQILSGLEKTKSDKPVALDQLLTGKNTGEIAPWVLRQADVPMVPAQPARAVWKVPAKLLKDRDKSSATELEKRLACPLGWVFEYAAKLYPSPIATLPDAFQLKGTFCHAVLEEVFGGGKPLPSEEEAVAAVGRVFDERLPLDAAPIAQPTRIAERIQLRRELVSATRTFVKALHEGGYRVVEMECEVSGAIDQRKLTGYIDCLVCNKKGQEAIIDFKYAGRSKYPELLKEGRATQLATYAHARGQETSRDIAGVAYLVLNEARLFTPSGTPLDGGKHVEVLEGPSIKKVYDDFHKALKQSEGWLKGEPVPARPLQEPEEWPKGAELVLKSKLKAGEEQGCCRYCNYPVLCGAKELA